MKSTVAALLLAAALATPAVLVLAPTPAAAQGLSVRIGPPPPPRAERPPHPPHHFRHAEWMPGHWTWNGRRYIWTAGYYVEGRPNAHWIPGHWDASPGGYVWTDGHWG